jgi:hypothetical protein
LSIFLVLVCAGVNYGVVYIAARSITIDDDRETLILTDIPTTSTRDMARSCIGFFAGACYISIALAAYRLSESLRPGAAATAVEKRTKLLQIFGWLSVVGVVLSVLLLCFSVYLAYWMSFWYEFFQKPLYKYTLASRLGFKWSDAFAPTPLHSIHAILAFCQLIACGLGIHAAWWAPPPQVTTSVTYRAQYPMQPAYVVQQQAYVVQPYPQTFYPSQAYPVSREQYPASSSVSPPVNSEEFTAVDLN